MRVTGNIDGGPPEGNVIETKSVFGRKRNQAGISVLTSPRSGFTPVAAPLSTRRRADGRGPTPGSPLRAALPAALQANSAALAADFSHTAPVPVY